MGEGGDGKEDGVAEGRACIEAVRQVLDGLRELTMPNQTAIEEQ